ncbi:MAG: LysM peptidoglycan-binding domain-containing protein [Kiritimatiellae bacterium]|nr:LysM peptidoglycan-binding domain-containing protein [Kiritimatiellia bacterium]
MKDLLEEENESSNHVAIVDDAALLRREGSAEITTGSLLLPPRATGDVVRAEKKADGKAAVRPPTYEVQEGDTLYKIAVRFYGSIRAWRMIRDANKTLISTDGRVQAGDTIRLP